MQTMNALVALSGDRNNMIFRNELTPAEIILLQALHGADAVLQIEPTGEVKREPMQEVERLKTLYPLHQARVQNIWRDWPGPSFPTRLEQIGINPALMKAQEASKPFTVSAKSA
jgi:hypothetical protein